MNDVFRAILNMSVTGGIAALAVILLRIPLKREPRWISCALWVVVFLRLAVPVSFSAPVSLLGGIGAPEPVNGTVTYLTADQSAFAVPSGKTAQDISGIFSARIWLRSTSSVVCSEKRLFRLSASAFAVSMEVRHGIARSIAFLRIFTLSREGSRPLDEVEMM